MPLNRLSRARPVTASMNINTRSSSRGSRAYPSLCFKEQNLVWTFDGVGVLNFARLGVCLSHRPDAPPIPPLGCLVIGYITRADSQGVAGRYPMRTLYLSALGPDGYIDGIDYPGKHDGGTLVRPDSVLPGVPHAERPTTFRRNPHVKHITNRLAARLAEHKKAWQRYADAHGFVLPPDHREQLDGNHIPF
jgi:hypothetical protein